MITEPIMLIAVLALPFSTSAIIAASCRRSCTLVTAIWVAILALVWATSVRYAALSLSVIITSMTLIGYVVGRCYKRVKVHCRQ